MHPKTKSGVSWPRSCLRKCRYQSNIAIIKSSLYKLRPHILRRAALVGTCTLDVTVAPGTVVCGHCDCGCDPSSRAAVAGGAVIATSFVPTYVGHTVCGGWQAMWRRGRRRSRGAAEEDPLPRLLTICLQSPAQACRVSSQSIHLSCFRED